jgi:hypothetical protein
VFQTSPPRRCAAVILALALALPAAARAQTSKSGAVPAHATYAWSPIHTQPTTDPRLASQPFQVRMRSAVEHGLAQRGLRKVDAVSQAQLLLAYYVSIAEKAETRPSRMPTNVAPCATPGCSGGWGVYGSPPPEMRNVRYEQGTLVLDVLDSKTGQLVWRASSKHRIEKAVPTDARLQEVVNETLADLKVGG